MQGSKPSNTSAPTWAKTRVSARLGIEYPIIQGPLGGLSSQRLTAAVSNYGGLGSFGAHGLTPIAIKDVIAELRSMTDKPFAVNLWVSMEDAGARTSDEAAFNRSLAPLVPLIQSLGAALPPYKPYSPMKFEEQVRVLINAKVPAFSFIVGIPPGEILDECRLKGIVTIGTATTPDEAIELQNANVDIIVASGFEAGGHRGSFLRASEDSLTGMFSLVPQVADRVSVPVVAAGGIADVRGIVAAFALGAEAVQIGTAFLACEESGASSPHRQALLSGNAGKTALTKEPAMSEHISYRTVKVDGLSIFYREAGPKDAPTILLLHGLPSSSRMFEPLLTRLAGEFHLVAPDYPGFGHSDAPTPKEFAYTFDHIAAVMDHFTEALGLTRYTLYMQDYGGPVGFRMALAHPDRIEALIVQDAVAHNEGLGANWKTRRAFWVDRAAHEAALRTNLLSLETTRTRHVGSDPNPERYDPDLWTDEYAFLNKPGQADIQSDLFYDYRTNVDAYPKWQEWMQKTQPRLLVLWGKHDLSFALTEPEAYRRDVPKAQVHILDAGHFALDTAADEIADLARRFMSSPQ